MLTFCYLSVNVENVSIITEALVGDSGSTLCSMVIPNFACFEAFRYIRIYQRNNDCYQLPKRYLTLTFPRWTVCIANNVRVFLTIFNSFYEGKCRMSGRVVHNQYRHCIRVQQQQLRTANNFSCIKMKCDKFAFSIGNYVSMWYYKFL